MRLEDLQVPFPSRARFLYETVRGIDSSPVLPVGQNQPKVSVHHEFGDDTNDSRELERALYELVERLGKELRKRRLTARRIRITLDYSDGMRRVRQAVVKPPSANDLTLFDLAGRTLFAAWTRRVRIRHMRLIGDRLIFPPAQQDLFASDRKENEKQAHLVAVIDRVRDRFGHNAVRMGRMGRLSQLSRS
jgi:DNA polymerase-4